MAEGVRGWWGLACMARGHAWWGGACVAGVHVWQGACVAGGMCGGACMTGNVYGRGRA